jgi:hypothetical protein
LRKTRGGVMLVELAEAETPYHPQRWLCRCNDRSPFAYARGHDYIRRSDDTLWAHLSDGVLISARSGDPLAYQVGNAFYDYQTRQPVYYEPP